MNELKLTFVNAVFQLPVQNLPVMIRFIKGEYGGQIGTFLTQGYYKEQTNEWRPFNPTRIWFDYTGRQICDLDAKKSKNQVIEWAYL